MSYLPLGRWRRDIDFWVSKRGHVTEWVIGGSPSTPVRTLLIHGRGGGEGVEVSEDFGRGSRSECPWRQLR